MGARVRSWYKTFALGAAFCCSAIFGGANGAAATSPSAAHGFVGSTSIRAFNRTLKAESATNPMRAGRQSPQFAGDGMPTYFAGSFPIAPYDETEDYGNAGPYQFPYPPPYAVWRAAMPPPCVTPLVIEIGTHQEAKLPKVTYGSSLGRCPPPVVEAEH
jgi:hypothetical protein